MDLINHILLIPFAYVQTQNSSGYLRRNLPFLLDKILLKKWVCFFLLKALSN